MRTYPWGELPPTCADAAFDDPRCEPPGGRERFGEVALYPPSAEGLYDMAGNVAEYVAFDEGHYTDGYPEPPLSDFEGEDCFGVCEPSPLPVMRGGGWGDDGSEQLRSAHRRLLQNQGSGNRCVRIP